MKKMYLHYFMLLLSLVACDDTAYSFFSSEKIEKNVVVPVVKKPSYQNFVLEDFHYASKDTRDPFKPFIAGLMSSYDPTIAQENDENLYKYDVSQYKLTAVLVGQEDQYGLLEDPSGVSHIVRVGQKVGKTGGRIVRIYKEGLQILDTYDDVSGKKVMVPIEIALPRMDLNFTKGQ